MLKTPLETLASLCEGTGNSFWTGQMRGPADMHGQSTHTCCPRVSLDFTHAFDSIPPPAFAYKSQNIWGVSSDDGGVDRAASLYSPIWVYVSARRGKTLAATKAIIYKGGAAASGFAARCSAPLCSRLPLMVQDFHWGCTEAWEIFLLICSCHLHGCLIRCLGSIECGSKLMASAVRTFCSRAKKTTLSKPKLTLRGFFCFPHHCKNYNH